MIENYKLTKGVLLDTDLDEEDWDGLIKDFKNTVKEKSKKDFPQDVYQQLFGAISAVFLSWESNRAKVYRKLNQIPSEWGTAVNVQSMVFGNMGNDCATGVVFTRNPSDGVNDIYGEYLINAQGEDVVAGTRTPQYITKKAKREAKVEALSMEESMPKVYLELHKIGSRVLSVIALSLEIDKNFFTPWIEKGNSLLRSIHYPPVDSSLNPHRARAHEDINLITLLIGAEEGGLEVLNKDGSWIKVSPSSEAIVCNIGDMMQLVTDKKLKSTTHRVIQDKLTESKPRYSIPFFLHPAPSINLKSIFRKDDKGILADDFLNLCTGNIIAVIKSSSSNFLNLLLTLLFKYLFKVGLTSLTFFNAL